MLQNDRRFPGANLSVSEEEIARTLKDCGRGGHVVNLASREVEGHRLRPGSFARSTKSPHVDRDRMFTRKQFPFVITDPGVGKSPLDRFAIDRFNNGRTATGLPQNGDGVVRERASLSRHLIRACARGQEHRE